MTRLPSVVTAGATCDRHIHAAIFAAAGRTWSLSHRRGETCVQANGRRKFRRKGFVLEEPRVPVPKYRFAGGESKASNYLMISGFANRKGSAANAVPGLRADSIFDPGLQNDGKLQRGGAQPPAPPGGSNEIA
jgi:hypothetical protein